VARFTVLLNAAAGCTLETKLLNEKSLKLILDNDALARLSMPEDKEPICEEIPDVNDPILELIPDVIDPILVPIPDVIELILSPKFDVTSDPREANELDPLAHVLAIDVPYLLPTAINAPISPLTEDAMLDVILDAEPLVNPVANPESCDNPDVDVNPTAPDDKEDNPDEYCASAEDPSFVISTGILPNDVGVNPENKLLVVLPAAPKVFKKSVCKAVASFGPATNKFNAEVDTNSPFELYIRPVLMLGVVTLDFGGTIIPILTN
jgi:hypothetical protein